MPPSSVMSQQQQMQMMQHQRMQQMQMMRPNQMEMGPNNGMGPMGGPGGPHPHMRGQMTPQQIQMMQMQQQQHTQQQMQHQQNMHMQNQNRQPPPKYNEMMGPHVRVSAKLKEIISCIFFSVVIYCEDIIFCVFLFDRIQIT